MQSPSKYWLNSSIAIQGRKHTIGMDPPMVNERFTEINHLLTSFEQICPRGVHPQRLPAAGGGIVVLIVANNPHLARIWARHLERQGSSVTVVHGQADATDFMRVHNVDVIVLDLNLEDGSALAIADYASYRRPSARIVFVSNSTFFSDGSIFKHIPNAAAMVPEQTPPNDLAAIVEYHGWAS